MLKIILYAMWGLWAVLAVLAKILLGASWWVATSWLWLPLAVIFVAMLFLNVSVDIGKALKIREENKLPKECDNCLFGIAAQYDKDGKCLGETLDETIKRPKVCRLYKRQAV